MVVEFTILGECASAKNSRDIVRAGGTGRWLLVKSKKARAYEKAVKQQAPRQEPLLMGPLRMTATMFYATERPDLDAGLLLDALESIIYANDRQVRELHLFHAISRSNPRAEVRIEPIQEDLLAGAAA